MQVDDDEWKSKLTAEQYTVLRKGQTEAAFSGKLLHNQESGSYSCAACGNKLFESDAKFDSGSGWPSFYDVCNTDAVKLKADYQLSEPRVEVTCAKCGSHLGHVFNDAPDQPTGMRFCINSVALNFKNQRGQADENSN